MRELFLLMSNYLVFIFIATGLAALQASLWLHVFGYSPAPYLWLTIINYWTLYRSITEAVIMNYFTAFILITMSGIPLEMAFAVQITLFFSIYLLRDRVLWSGPNSFMLSSGIAALILPISIYIWSRFIEVHPSNNFHFFDWIMRSLLTAIFSLPLYYVFIWVDRITQKDTTRSAEPNSL